MSKTYKIAIIGDKPMVGDIGFVQRVKDMAFSNPVQVIDYDKVFDNVTYTDVKKADAVIFVYGNIADLSQEAIKSAHTFVEKHDVNPSRQYFMKQSTDVKTVQETLNEIKTEEALEKENAANKAKVLEYKNILGQYLDNQIARMKQSDAGTCHKVKVFEYFKKELKSKDNLDDIKKFVSTVRYESSRHRETGVFGMLFKFNWIRNTASYNAINAIFNIRNDIKPKAVDAYIKQENDSLKIKNFTFI